ncbi:hypothetical protein HYDPIDRAFT_103064, partial [Hydnomerulius pinastri MD-312]
IVDAKGRVIAVLAGAPEEKGWCCIVEDASRELVEAGKAIQVGGKDPYRRGKFPTLAVGVSYGGGQMAPKNLDLNVGNSRLAQKLLQSAAIQCIAGFGNSSFAFYAPKLHRFYAENLDSLFKNDPQLCRNFPRNVFPAATFNCGGKVYTLRHLDSTNIAHGWCSIWAGGSFDPKKGGHLILFKLGLVIEFPPGSTVLIPSSIVSHGNVPIRDGESRVSFTQYCAGGLLRWVQHGFRAVKTLPAKVYSKINGPGSSRWARMLDFSLP